MTAALRIGGLAAALFATTQAPAASQEPHQPARATSQPPALNHIYVVLDAASYAAIRESRDLAKHLGPPDGGLPDYAPPAPDADRVFFRGRQTYLEIFGPENRFGEPVGKVGLALGYDDPASFDALENAWRTTCPDQIRRSGVEWRRTQPTVPWYDALQCDDTAVGPQMAMWAMVYRPEFVRWQSGASGDSSSRTTRAEVLAPRRAAGQGRFDIKGATIQVSAPLHAKLVSQLERAGFDRQDRADGARLRGDGWELLLRKVDGPTGLLTLRLATDMPLSNDLILGGARMTQPTGGGPLLQFEIPGPNFR